MPSVFPYLVNPALVDLHEPQLPVSILWPQPAPQLAQHVSDCAVTWQPHHMLANKFCFVVVEMNLRENEIESTWQRMQHI